jgi:hypothetical protein
MKIHCFKCQMFVLVKLQPYGDGLIGICPQCGVLLHNKKEVKKCFVIETAESGAGSGSIS